uniref:KAT8 regulatory NSL complex subunit 2 n=1 Tax=Rhizophora mucronata TaxID=61149 RepID=A0A2P2M0W3_RHIMU
MTAPARHHQQPSSSKPPKNPTTINPTTPLGNHFQNPSATASLISPSQEDDALSRATHITRQELLKRRSYKLKQLSKCYRDHYWALMDELKFQYRDYYWRYGVSPFKEDHPRPRKQDQGGDIGIEGIGENNNNNNGNGLNVNWNSEADLELKNNRGCLFVGCRLKAMALTSFCHLHILSDAKQKLYKPCDYIIKSAQSGPITCGKPILRSTTPSLCTVHFQKAQKHVTRALRKAGLNVSLSSKVVPKFHVIVAEYVHQIQTKRRAAKRENRSDGVKQEVNTS